MNSNNAYLKLIKELRLDIEEYQLANIGVIRETIDDSGYRPIVNYYLPNTEEFFEHADCVELINAWDVFDELLESLISGY